MKVRKIKQVARCSYCKINRATVSVHGHSYYGKTACDDCLKALREIEKPESEHLTEADYQTWMRI